jgi:molybdopterin-guanine dinucleotide biosynthesis protein A
LSRCQPADISLVLSAAADCPSCHAISSARLHQALTDQNAQLAVAASDSQYPVIGLWASLRDELRHSLVEDIRKIDRGPRVTASPSKRPTTPLDPFFNANTAGHHGSRSAGGAGWRMVAPALRSTHHA